MKIKMKLKMKCKVFFYVQDLNLASPPIKNDKSYVQAIKFFPTRRVSSISSPIPA